MLDLIHSLTHAHRLVTKPGVGAMRLCRRRLSSRVDVEVLPEGVSDPIGRSHLSCARERGLA